MLHGAGRCALAERGRGRTSPNPMVGAVVVDAEGVVVGRGAHEAPAGRTPRSMRSRDAGDRARGATLYCTLEPCSPHRPHRAVRAARRRGRHPPGVIAIEDPNPLVSGRGLDLPARPRHRGHGRRPEREAAGA